MFLMNPALEALNRLHPFSCGSPQNRFHIMLKTLLFYGEADPMIFISLASLDKVVVIFLPIKGQSSAKSYIALRVIKTILELTHSH